MNFYVLTLFPEMIQNGLSHSILGRAQQEQKIHLSCINIRDFSTNKYRQVDDYPYGGGAGMVMQPQPIFDAYQSIETSGKRPRVLYMTPQGKPFEQEMAKEFSQEENLIFLCGHYEGIDERVIEEIVTDEVSIGDFVLTGGELAAMVIMDAVARLIPGVLGKSASCEEESFSGHLLEYPQYTRPQEFREHVVPEILLSGHHGNIEKWRKEQSLIRTLQKRPDLLDKAELSPKEREFLQQLQEQNEKRD